MMGKAKRIAIALMAALLAVTFTMGSVAYHGSDRSFLNGRTLRVCDREPDGNQAKARAGGGNMREHLIAVDTNGFGIGCGISRTSGKPAWHQTGEEGKAWGKRNYH
jgi:hypothetical protein